MVDYEVTISTSFLDDAGTSDNVFIKLLGFDGESEHTKLEGDSPFTRGAVSRFTVSCPASIGDLLQIQLNTQHVQGFPEESKWFPTKVVVKSPEGKTDKILILQWIDDCEVHCFPEATDIYMRSSFISDIWDRFFPPEIDYSWYEPEVKIPHHLKAESFESLPDGKFSFIKNAEFNYTALTALAEIKLKGLSNSKETWADIEDINGVFLFKRTDISASQPRPEGTVETPAPGRRR